MGRWKRFFGLESPVNGPAIKSGTYEPPKPKRVWAVEIITEDYNTDYKGDRRYTDKEAERLATNIASYGTPILLDEKLSHYLMPNKIKGIKFHNMEEENASKPEPKNDNDNKSEV